MVGEEVGELVVIGIEGKLRVPGSSSPEEGNCSGIGDVILSFVAPNLFLSFFFE